MTMAKEYWAIQRKRLTAGFILSHRAANPLQTVDLGSFMIGLERAEIFHTLLKPLGVVPRRAPRSSAIILSCAISSSTAVALDFHCLSKVFILSDAFMAPIAISLHLLQRTNPLNSLIGLCLSH